MLKEDRLQNTYLPIPDEMDNQKKIHLEKTIKAFTYNVMGVTLPFILSIFPIIILSQYEALIVFIDQGNFLLFGAGLYTTSLYLFGENRSSIKHTKDKVLFNLSLWLLIITSAIYAIIYGLALIPNATFQLNTSFIRTISLLLFCISIFAVYRSLFVDILKTYPEVNIKDVSKKGVDDILNQL